MYGLHADVAWPLSPQHDLVVELLCPDISTVGFHVICKIMNRPDLKVIGVECATPFFDDMSFIQDQVNYVVSELLFPPQFLETAIIQE